MKIIFFSLAIVMCATFAKAQLANTKWSGTAMVPDPTQIDLSFKKDTLKIMIAGQKDILETMTYTVKDSVITITKINGGSPCNEGSIATMKYRIKDDKLFLSVLKDPCSARESAWSPEPYIKVKE